MIVGISITPKYTSAMNMPTTHITKTISLSCTPRAPKGSVELQRVQTLAVRLKSWLQSTQAFNCAIPYIPIL